LRKIVGMLLLVIGASGAAVAGAVAPPAPEIDAGSCVAALALVSGAVLVVRGRRKKS